jgi:hypothetical protein
MGDDSFGCSELKKRKAGIGFDTPEYGFGSTSRPEA